MTRRCLPPNDLAVLILEPRGGPVHIREHNIHRVSRRVVFCHATSGIGQPAWSTTELLQRRSP
jgi:hypothetical protein